ncbi:hypothetical protein [Agromyces sp. Leaf222]|uniref:hypothetical protein n=1 Tax=Agromyces sp. Leaf222 TaxID=1735688 RepID=UPI0006F55B2A|nr:hypothetical protein [Agromyces sp. Leaf222]KQM84142.1 hypothetical protein ASE68_13800 [Agromyces sp. Leaf222]
MGWRRLASIIASIGLLAGLLTAMPAVTGTGTQPASAAVGSGFDPGNIISDAVFYNSGTMTVTQVQSFLNAQVSTCRAGYTCLKSYRQSTPAQPARSEGCAATAATTNETAASIIVRVGKACGINPRVLLVLLEKEQGLVSDTWPTSRQYRSATGYGCPDTADCDANYYGFFNQVYHASWQFKKYRARPDRAYAAGRWNTIQWHPNAACGTSSVYIQNQATAGLYLYTPYRPNAAALANLYGTGDGCSSYGNRNFWRMFTDWFGSTQKVDDMIARAEGGSMVYLIAGGAKHYITTPADLTEFATGLGGIRILNKSFLDSIPTGRNATVFLRNTQTGRVALLQGGSTHWFPSCELVAVWGSTCGASGYLDVSDGLFARYKVGGTMSKFGTGPDGVARMLERPVASKLIGAAPTAFNGGKAPYMARISSTLLASYTTGRTLAAPHSYIRSKTTGQYFYVDGRNSLQRLRDWTYATEYGLPKTAVNVDESIVTGYKKAADVGLIVSCGSVVYSASNGSFVQLKGGAGGLPAAPLASETCRLLKKSTAVVKGPLFLQANGAPEVNLVRYAKLRHITSPAQLTAQNGGSWPTIVKVSPTTLAKITKGGAAMDIGSFVSFTGTTGVYLVNGWQLVRLPKWEIADQYGLARGSTALPAARRDGYVDSAKPLGTFAKCGATDVFAVTEGKRQGVGATALAGNAFTTLQTTLCAKLPVRGTRIDGPLFLAAGSDFRVAVAGGFAPISAAAMREANAGVAPAPLKITAVSMAVLPARGAAPAAGTLIKASNSGAVVFVDGAAKHALPNWGVAADLGIATRYSVVHPAEPALLKTETPKLGVFVRSGGQTYVASAGVLNRVVPELVAGFEVAELSDAALKTLKTPGLDIRRDLVLKDAATGILYRPTAGSLVVVTAASLPAGSTVLPLDTRTIAGMLAG